MKTGKAPGAGAALYFALSFAPVLYLLTRVRAGGDALLSARRLGLMANSLLLGLLVASLCMIAGLAAAQGIRRGPLARRGCRWFFLLLAPVPPYVYALSWLSVARLWRLNPTGMLPSVAVEVLAYLPVCTGISLLALERLPKEPVQLALLMGREKKAFWDVVLPSVFPQVLASGGLVFILSVTDFSIPSLFQVNVYAMEIFSDYSAQGRTYHSFLLSLPLTAVAAVVMLLCMDPVKSILMAAPSGAAPPVRGGAAVAAAAWAGVAVCLFQVAFPLAALSPHLPSLGQAILLSWEELAVSCLTGVLAGLLALAPAALAAECLLALRGKKWLWYLLLFPIALPGSIIGLGLLELVNKSPFHRLGRTVWMPALGLAVHYLPYLLLLLVGAFARLDRDKLALGRVLARTRAKYLFRVRLPMLSGGLLAAFSVAFMLSMADVGTVLMLMPAGMEPLSVKIYNYLHYGSSELVAGFCYFQVLLCMAVMLLTGLFLSARKKERRGMDDGRQERGQGD
ncbi:ABC transporter permease [Candidatus Allofournierella excrementavium]|uniref:ABC transporter permease n=1 Tax=Candidatus Allofournierella excrementavium TaxID=2838591 RepID=UPI003AF4E818